ncbi:MAG: TIGR03915 family putative DNA repair protein, partial [Rhizobiaceae bacterium]|nr:TIGR03915 family putative DNA repair protein [Rhizobiaceae bacterium]
MAAGADLEGFRRAARGLIADGIPPEDVVFAATGEASLFAPSRDAEAAPFSLPRAAGDLIETVVCHRDSQRYALLYALVWRIRQGERCLLEVHSDPLVHRLAMMNKSVRRDLHKMHAFLRFRRVEGETERYAAWFEPDHFILRATAQFFVDRFRSLIWSIFTPDGSLHWDRERLTHGPAGTTRDAPASDRFEEGWLGYYESTFNPARLNQTAMRAEMPKKYWRNMPEARAIPALV